MKVLLLIAVALAVVSVLAKHDKLAVASLVLAYCIIAYIAIGFIPM